MCELCNALETTPGGEALIYTPSSSEFLVRGKKTEADVIAEACKPGRLQTVMTPAMLAELEAWTARVFADLGVTGSFNMINPRVVTFAEEFSSTRIVGINRTTQKAIRAAVRDGILDGDGAAAIGKRIEAVFTKRSRKQAVTIARTEAGDGANFGTFEAHKQSKVVKFRMWITTVVGARPNHIRLNRQVRSIKKKFTVGRHSAWRPYGFSSAAMNINCRCTTVAKIKKKDLTDLEILYEWKKFDRRLLAWEAAMKRTFRTGLKRQQRDVLRVAREVL